MGKTSSLKHCQSHCQEKRNEPCDGTCFKAGYEYALMDMQCLEDHENLKKLIPSLQTLAGEIDHINKMAIRDRVLSIARRLKQHLGE
jgi:hypothetical protein